MSSAVGVATTVAGDDRPLSGARWRSVAVDGRRVRYEVVGDGLPVVFLHGWGLGHRSYRHTLARVVDQGCQVWAPSLPGFGGSAPLAASDATLGDYGDWVAAYLDAVGVDEPVFLIGHSFGGGVAIAATHRHRSRVRTLVLVNSIGGGTWKEAVEDEDGVAGPARLMADRPLWDWGRHFSGDLLPLHLARQVVPTVLPDALGNVLRSPRSLWRAGHLARTADLTEELEDLKRWRVPVVALSGSRDEVIPRASFDALCRAIGSPGETVEGSHSWLLADPDAFGEVITNAVQVASMARAEERRASPGPRRWSRRANARWRRWRDRRRAAGGHRDRAGDTAPAP